MAKNYNKNLFLTLFFILIVFATNNYFDYEDSLIFGGSDGQFYILISKYSPDFGINIEYIKGERFFLPYLLGIISKLSLINLYSLYQITSIFLIITLILLYHKILILSKIENYFYYFSILLVIFNPYLIRYYLAVPTIIVDLSFIISLEIIAIGFLKKQTKFFFLGLIIATLSRQNSIIIIFVFFIIKFIFKNKSILQYKDLILLSICYIIIFLVNTYYAINSSGNLQEVESLYSTTLFGILIFDYNLIDLFRYLYFPLLGFGPLITFVLILLYLRKFTLNNGEFIIFSLIVSILLIGIAFIGGPTTTGKNLIRLSNFSYIYLIIIINAFFQTTKNREKIASICLIFSSFLFLWSLHPTFSNVKLWKFMSNYINF
tara:strand:- start:8207 stop:9331 length:1125 start_codon:yes stop_codon:yes gene_type:complete